MHTCIYIYISIHMYTYIYIHVFEKDIYRAVPHDSIATPPGSEFSQNVQPWQARLLMACSEQRGFGRLFGKLGVWLLGMVRLWLVYQLKWWLSIVEFVHNYGKSPFFIGQSTMNGHFSIAKWMVGWGMTSNVKTGSMMIICWAWGQAAQGDHFLLLICIIDAGCSNFCCFPMFDAAWRCCPIGIIWPFLLNPHVVDLGSGMGWSWNHQPGVPFDFLPNQN